MNNFIARYKANIIDINPAQVISESKVEKYEVLPRHIGIAQLVSQGKIQKFNHEEDFKIVKAFDHLPSGLSGGYQAAKFYIR